jgi:hypothetical protein
MKVIAASPAACTIVPPDSASIATKNKAAARNQFLNIRRCKNHPLFASYF